MLIISYGVPYEGAKKCCWQVKLIVTNLEQIYSGYI